MRKRPRRRVEDLTFDQVMELNFGAYRGSAFPSDEARRNAWGHHRDAFLRGEMFASGHAGCRPWAWWVYDQGEEYPQGEVDSPPFWPWDAHSVRLNELGELTDKERLDLLEQEREYLTGGNDYYREGTPEQWQNRLIDIGRELLTMHHAARP